MTSPAVDDFARAPRVFCTALEGTPAASALVAGIAELVALAEQLPDHDPEPEAPEPPDPPRWSPPALPLDLYWVVLDPFGQIPGDAAAGSLYDDLMDLRRGLLAGLWLHDRGFVDAACWEWRFSYHTHWGAHATGALWALFRHRSHG